ncbi:MAG: amino acid permease [Bryobacterales bacterium]|nr:amino acid permease [Bryobacterales bacterium]
MSELKRDLGVWGAASIVVGTVIGSGIFLVPKSMVLNVGSAEMVIFVFIFGGLLSLAGALTYAELSAAMPEAGGEYVYLREAYGPFFAFLYGWTQMWVAKSGSIATLATAFFTYMANFFPALEATITEVHLPLLGLLTIKTGQIFAMVVIGLLGWLNYFGVRVGGNVQVGVTIVKVGLIALLIVVGLTFSGGDTANFTSSIPATGGIAGFFAALVAALWAYDGWNNVSMVSSEVKNPQRNLPLALVFGTLAVMAIYILANLAYFYVLSASAVAGSDRVAAEMMRRVWGAGGANAVSIAAMISIFAALNGSILTGSRVPYAMARDGLFFKSIGEVHPKYFTPANSIIALTAWSMILILSGGYDQLFTYVIFASWILYGMATASVLVLRRKRPDLPRPYKAVGYPVIPIVFVLVAIALILSTLQKSPRESLLGLGIMATGIPFYLHWKRKLKA